VAGLRTLQRLRQRPGRASVVCRSGRHRAWKARRRLRWTLRRFEREYLAGANWPAPPGPLGMPYYGPRPVYRESEAPGA
jgi:hypothetical protein